MKKTGLTASPGVMSFYGIRHFMIVSELTMPYQNTAGSDVVRIFACRDCVQIFGRSYLARALLYYSFFSYHLTGYCEPIERLTLRNW